VYSRLRQKFGVILTRTLYPTFLAGDTDLVPDMGCQPSLGRGLFTQRCCGYYIFLCEKKGSWNLTLLPEFFMFYK
jgi:hypothetical protein